MSRPTIYQLRVSLEEIEPEVWRRIQVRADVSFWALHCAIQDAMGWKDCHLHEFRLPAGSSEVRIGIPDEDGWSERECLPGWDVPLRRYLVDPGLAFSYVYDFGDGWMHHVTFEEEREAAAQVKYPLCVIGERACPPEDCGGPAGYSEFLEAILDPAHEEHDAMRSWFGGEFDPARFDPGAVRFSDPRRRLRRAGLGAIL